MRIVPPDGIVACHLVVGSTCETDSHRAGRLCPRGLDRRRRLGAAAGEIVLTGARELVAALTERARGHVDTVCVERTHGVHAEPTTFGIKLAGFAIEAVDERVERPLTRHLSQPGRTGR